MQKIDRLGWAAGICFTAYGVRIGIRVNKPDILKRLAESFPPGWKLASRPVVDRLYSLVVGGEATRPNVRLFHLLYAGPARLARTMVLDDLLETLEGDLQLYTAEAARRRLFVHAGVVGWGERAIVIPGLSRSGKTTLVAALLRAGASYYSDEYAVFDSRGRVHPYPKALSIRGEPDQRPQKCAPQALGGRAGTRPLPVGLVVAARYRPGARWRPQVLSPGRAVMALLRQTVSIRRQPELALTILQQVAAQARTLSGVRGEAEDVVAALLGTARANPHLFENNGIERMQNKRETSHVATSA
jgi:hypothetical protein